jgi:hypothetical protein
MLVGGWREHETKIEVGVLKSIKTRHIPLSQLLMSQMKRLKSILSMVGSLGKQNTV